MEDIKPWYTSKTVWGGIIAVGAGVAGAFGVAISPADQAHLSDIVVVIATSIGGLLAIVGRIKASKAVK